MVIGSGYGVMTTSAASFARILARVSSLVDTHAGSPVGCVRRLVITVPAKFLADVHIRLVRTCAISRVILAHHVLLAIGHARYVATIANATRSAANCVPHALRYVDGYAFTGRIPVVCPARFHATLCLAIDAVRRSYAVATNAQGFVERNVQTQSSVKNAVRKISVSETSI